MVKLGVLSRYTCYKRQDIADSPITQTLGTVITIWLTFTWFLDFVHLTFRQPALLPSSSEDTNAYWNEAYRNNKFQSLPSVDLFFNLFCSENHVSFSMSTPWQNRGGAVPYWRSFLNLEQDGSDWSALFLAALLPRRNSGSRRIGGLMDSNLDVLDSSKTSCPFRN
jgi:hypothetical protein